jgi:transcription factor SPN1
MDKSDEEVVHDRPEDEVKQEDSNKEEEFEAVEKPVEEEEQPVEEAGKPAGEEEEQQQTMEEEQTVENQPAQEREGANKGADSSDDELSELEEEEVVERPIDEEVYKISSHRKKGGSTSGGAQKEKKQERKRTRHEETPPNENDDEVELDPETKKRQEIERKLDAALKSGGKKRKKLDGDDIEQMQDEKVSQLREQMRAAAIHDAECIRNGQPAVAKLQLLPRVKAALQKHNLADSILDNNLLETIRMWLEPLPDASLPAFEIQKELFAAIDRLPIKTIHLRESGLGKVVLFYQRSKRPQLSIKRTADRLIGNWTRPIMGRSDNYRDKFVISKTYDPDAASSAMSAAVRSSENTDINTMSAAEAAAVRRNRAHIPSAQAVSFQVAPKSTIAATPGSQRGGEDQYKRLRQKMQNAKARAKKSGVSIEGRGL